jgi:hypothetical protein
MLVAFDNKLFASNRSSKERAATDETEVDLERLCLRLLLGRLLLAPMDRVDSSTSLIS